MSRYCSTCRLTGEHPETRRLLNPANIEPVESSGAAAAAAAAAAADTAATANVEFDVDATTFDNAVDACCRWCRASYYKASIRPMLQFR